MMAAWHWLVSTTLPFEWARHAFMRNALAAVVLVSPVYAVVGTMIVNNRMAFFSDSIGHSALTGIALGVIAGLREPLAAVAAYSVALAVVFSLAKGATRASADTITGVLSSTSVALGIVILSRQGGFQRYSSFLVGDILGVNPRELSVLAAVLVGVAVLWWVTFNMLLLVSTNESLARSRGLNPRVVETVFCVAVAVVVAVSIRLVGILVVNSLLVLPAACARNVSTGMRQYHAVSVLASLFSGVLGLIASYYLGTATGATIVLAASALYAITVVAGGRVGANL